MNEIIKNDEMMCSDDFPESLKRFSENINKKNPGLHSENHNLYLLQTTDRDGNVTGEAYGMNLMTNKGFRYGYLESRDGFYHHNTRPYGKIYIGNGEGDISLTDTTLISPITTSGSTAYNGWNSYNLSYYPIQYDSSSGIISQTVKTYQGYFDYNISGITEDKSITEIGYGSDYPYTGDIGINNIYSHARIYDKDGNPSSITKRINERLTIIMYWTISMSKSIFEDSYNKGVYLFFQPHYFRPAYSGRTSYAVFDGGRSHEIFGVSSYTKSAYSYFYREYANRSDTSLKITSDDDNTIKAQWSTSAIIISSWYKDFVSNVIFANRSGMSGQDKSYGEGVYFDPGEFLLFTHETLSDPEEISDTRIYTNAYDSPFLNRIFDSAYDADTGYGRLPCTNFNITSLSMYNHITKEWDIEEEFVTDSNTDYNDTFYINNTAWMTFQGKSLTAYVYINIRPDLPITSFDNTNIVLYASDTWWDSDSWELISNINNINVSLQTKRYYIRTSPNAKLQLKPYRQMTRHQIVVSKEQYTLPVPQYIIYYNNCYPLSSDKYGWFMSSKYLIYPNTDNGCVYYPITVGPDNIDPTQSWRWTTEEGDRLIFACWYYDSNTKLYDVYLRIYNTTNPDSEPTYVDVKLDFTNQLGTGRSCSIYCTDSGFLAAKAFDNTTSSQMVIVDIYGTDEGPTQHRIDDVWTHRVLNRTDNVVYCGCDNHTSFKIYDMKNQSITDSFSIPSGYTYSGLVGWKDFIYVRVVDESNTYSIYFYNLNTKQLQQLITLGDIPNISLFNRQLSVDECMIIGGTSSDDPNIYIFKQSDPTNPIKLSTYMNLDIYKYIGYGSQLKYINNGKQLLFSNCSNFRYVVLDIGYILDKGPISYYPYKHYRYEDGSGSYIRQGMMGFLNNGAFIVNYNGEINWYPIEQLLPHKMTGTTTTIQCFNNPKRIGGRTYSITITNDTSRHSVDEST